MEMLNPAKTDLALHGFILDELKALWALFSPGGGLKTHLAPLFGSCERPIKMPALAPNAQKLCVANVMLATQHEATGEVHRDAVKELTRVLNISNQTGTRGEEARKFLFQLRLDLLAAKDQIAVKFTHSLLPVAYFAFISPRFMEVPTDPRALVLRFKLGNTKKFPFTCLELLDKNEVCLPWTTVDSKKDGYKKCEKSFPDYTALVRHLATRHVVLWLSFMCPWCSYCGFEKAKATRHVSTCKSMPAEAVALVEAVELHAPPDKIFKLVKAASKHLDAVRANDAKHGLKTRITLAMTRSEGKFRAYAESVKAGSKQRWKKSVKPDTEGYYYEDDGTSVYSERFQKFPYFIRCGGCSRVMMDTEVASLPHLQYCGIKGFMMYHSQKLIDDGVVSEADRRILKWKDSIEKAAENFQPTISCTVDGYGGSNKEKSSRKRLRKVMKKAEVKDGYRAKQLIVKDEEEDLAGNLRIIGTEIDQQKFKTELTDKVLQLSAFDNLVRKRKMCLDVATNQKRKCTRRTTPRELFLDAHYERIQAEIAVLDMQAKQLQAERFWMGKEPEDESEAFETVD